MRTWARGRVPRGWAGGAPPSYRTSPALGFSWVLGFLGSWVLGFLGSGFQGFWVHGVHGGVKGASYDFRGLIPGSRSPQGF